MLLYFIDGLASAGTDHLERLNLVHAFGDQELATRGATSGPEGTAGVVLAPDASACAYSADNQIWREISPAYSVRRWVGWWRDRPPTPESLARRELLDGSAVRLADGNEWVVPRAYQVDGGAPRCALPCSVRRDPAGRWLVGDVLPRYRDLWRISESVFTRAAEGKSDGASVAFDEVSQVLGANYRVGPDEVGALGLLDSTGGVYRSIVSILLDLDGLMELQKKT